MTRGTDLITAERRRQIDVEGYDAKHDEGEAENLARAGAAYAVPPNFRFVRQIEPDGPYVPLDWPWMPEYWKPDRGSWVRDLTRAGALIAAAIDAELADGAEAPKPKPRWFKNIHIELRQMGAKQKLPFPHRVELDGEEIVVISAEVISKGDERVGMNPSVVRLVIPVEKVTMNTLGKTAGES